MLYKNTNLSADSYISVEKLATSTACTPNLFLSNNVKQVTVVDGDTQYSVASSSGAGAGNRYEEIVFVLPRINPCYAIRYFIHSTVVENYPAGTVSKFDRSALINQFDLIRGTLVTNKFIGKKN